MRLRIASFVCRFFVVGAWAVYGQTSITPSQLPQLPGLFVALCIRGQHNVHYF